MKNLMSCSVTRGLKAAAIAVACCLCLVSCGDSNSGNNTNGESFQFFSLDPATQGNVAGGLNGPVGPVGPGTGQPSPIVPGVTGNPSPIFNILNGQGNDQREADVSINPSGFLAVTATSVTTGPYGGRRVFGERFSVTNFSTAPTSLGVDAISATGAYTTDVSFPKVATTLASQYVAVWANGLASGPYATSVRGQGVSAAGAFAMSGPYGAIDFLLEGGPYSSNVLGPYQSRTTPSIALATTTNQLAMTALKIAAVPLPGPYAVVTKLDPMFGLLAGFPKTDSLAADAFNALDGSTIAISADGTRIVAVAARNAGEVVATIFDGSGNVITPTFQVNTMVFTSVNRPNVAMFADGSFVVLFGGSDTNVYARTFNNVGAPQVPAEVLVGAGLNPDVAAEQNNLRFAVAWSFNDTVQFQRFTAPTVTAVGTAQDASTGGFGMFNAFPSVTVNPDGDAIVVWQSTDGVNTRVQGRAYPRP